MNKGRKPQLLSATVILNVSLIIAQCKDLSGKTVENVRVYIICLRGQHLTVPAN